MSGKYDKSIEISHEEEGTYHRREVDYRPPASQTTTTVTSHPVTTRYIERVQPAASNESKSSRALAASKSQYTSDDDSDNFQEWTTSKRKVNHKTRQVETRVSRQLLVRGGEVIADSGPQVTTRIKEDNKVEECEREKTPKNKSKFEALENAPEAAEAHGLVLGEKKEIQKVSREVREENMQYHDERFKELTGKDVHRRAIQAPHELITINDKQAGASSKPRGKMVHYSNKGKKYQDTDEILEVAKLAIDGSITKEVKRTKHHEEFSEDELPDEKGEAEQLRRKPVVERSSRRHADYVNDFDDPEGEPVDHHSATAAAAAAAMQRYDSDHARSPVRSRARPVGTSSSSSGSRPRHAHSREDDEAFPRYEIDPLLNSLRDEDFKPITSSATAAAAPRRPSSRHQVELVDRRRGGGGDRSPSSCSSSDAGERRAAAAGGGRVEVPEEYRVNRQKLMQSGSPSAARRGAAGSSLSHKSNRSPSSQLAGRASRRREDAATQARLTDEEVERHSLRSGSPSLNSHEKTTKYLQRQSTPNSSRHYYYGEPKRTTSKSNSTLAKGGKRPTSLSSSSSSSSSMSSLVNANAADVKGTRKQGVQSRDSGFKSPARSRAETPQQIYSVSKKSSSSYKPTRPGAVSPSGESLGQRSVKTTTSTFSAGLADRPLSRNDKENRKQKTTTTTTTPGGKTRSSDKFHDEQRIKRRQRQASEAEPVAGHIHNHHDDDDDDKLSVITITNNNNNNDKQKRQAFDNISLASLPTATKIQVPYQRVIEIEREPRQPRGIQVHRQQQQQQRQTSDKSGSEMSLQEDIESLSKRLASISQLKSGADRFDTTQHFDYKTIVANVHKAAPGRTLIDNSYNVRIQEQNSPFRQAAPAAAKDDAMAGGDHLTTSTNNILSASAGERPALADNNNEIQFSLDDYVKYRATPALVDQSLRSSSHLDDDDDDDDERMSQDSSVSLQSARTYNIRKLDAQKFTSNEAEVVRRQVPVEAPHTAAEEAREEEEEDQENVEQARQRVEFDENGNGKPAAWIFDPRDNSSTAIVPPTRPRRPETPKVDSKTEELAQARGGRSYYLELVEPKAKVGPTKRAPRPSSIDSLYSRWNSQGALNHATYRPLAAANAALGQQHLRQNSTSQSKLTTAGSQRIPVGASRSAAAQPPPPAPPSLQRRQLPFSGPPSSLSDRSKSSSCLLSVTKPSKYSIYGGFRKPGEANKPVPRLSYSRAIGPRSSRVDTTPSAPSRYLKMR